MTRLQRLTAILIHLQSKRIVKASEVAARFEISLRTVYRDIRALEEAGVPIGVEAGKGYFIINGYHLPPIMFTTEEAAALVTGEKLVEKLTDVSVQKSFSSALIKIKSVLREREKESIEQLDDSILIHQSPARENRTTPNWLSELQVALSGKREILISYFSRYSQESTQRKVHPIGLLHYSNAWHLIGYCFLRNDYRDFRVDRIGSLKVLDISTNSDKYPSLTNYLKNLSSTEKLVKVVLRFEKSVIQYIQEQKYYYGFVDQIEHDTFIEMTFMVHSLESIARWLTYCHTSVEITEPPELVSLTIAIAKSAYEHFLRQEEIQVTL